MTQKKKRPPKLLDDRLAVALSHETRETALALCSIRPTSTKEIADAAEVSVSNAWHHVEKLKQLGCIKEVSSRQRRGARERFYEATCDYYFDSKAWDALSQEERLTISMRVLRLIAGDVDKATRAKTIASDPHVSRTTIDLDAEGDEEAYGVLLTSLEGLLAVRENCVARKGKGGGKTTRTSFVLMQLKLPHAGEA
jgi:biotin operon repressor